ncbi:2-hydroxycarboxylate transporter family protein [Tunturiibacter gelidoferens]|uniref:Na+/citrate or Na+/malate symporter n=1 Tax=Tunturiibacter lichenicola TaxID=2051959 RepID=A0A7Y9NJK2_9BACT|nr:2-hydroxycarboxylate transporter family protein [Edaphobacter lichenicola]NYF50509.1 Na+/citrate or Na+/malate symporter [Edaphobacter lichenicola]
MLLELNSETQVRRQWPRWLSYRIGLLPLPVFVLLFGAVAALTGAHALTGDVSVMIATLAAGGFLCAWLGGLIPFLRRLGAPAITAAFLPSYLVYRHWLPVNLVETVTSFTKGTNFIYLYITAIIVGSILGMNRKLLLQGIAKVLIPLFAGSLMAVLIGSVAGVAIGLPLARIVTLVIVPVMAGGVGEGAIPLSIGYEDIFHQSSAEYLAHLLPVVLFANLVAIIMAGCLNAIGRRYPSLTGNGLLQPPSNILPLPASLNVAPIAPRNDQLCAAALFAISLYLLGIVSHFLLGFPPPVTMLVIAVLLKVSNLLPPWIDRAAAAVGHFFAVAVTYPLLFAVAVALTPWKSVKEALHPANLAVIVLVVLTLVVTGFFIGKWIHLYPVETAIVNACHTGAGGTGDVAILTAANRLELMPFAQIATRIGGAITVTLTLLILRFLTHGK